MPKAVIFDFDGTLTPNIRPVFQILEESGIEGGASNPEFFPKVGERAKRDGTNIYEAMAREIIDIAVEAGFPRTDESITLGAAQRKFNPGTAELLQLLKDGGVKSYLVSSGLQAYLKKLTIAPLFSQIYATTFSYDSDGNILDIVEVMTDEQKAVALTQVAEQINGNPEDFSGIVYIGDGTTDLVAMKHIKARGGNAILVHLPSDSQELQEAQATGVIDLQGLSEQAREIVDLYTLADFTEGSEARRFLESI